MEGVFIWIMKRAWCVALQSVLHCKVVMKKRGVQTMKFEEEGVRETLCLKHLTGNERFWR